MSFVVVSELHEVYGPFADIEGAERFAEHPILKESGCWWVEYLRPPQPLSYPPVRGAEEEVSPSSG